MDRCAAALAAAIVLLAPGAASADAAQIAATVCATCHGEGGRSTVASFPRLAAAPEEYLLKQLEDFQSGRRKNPAMAPFLANLKAGDFKELAAFYAAQQPSPAAPAAESATAAGRQLFANGNPATGVPACAGCHRADAAGSERFPRLAGQHRAYLADQLAQFKSGARSNDRGRVMRDVAQRLSEPEIAAVVDYLAGL